METPINRWIAPLLWPLCLVNFAIARPAPKLSGAKPRTVSVVIPARNEAGNIENVVRRTPELGEWTEIIFVEGHSKDNTWQEIQRVAEKYNDRRIIVHRQSGEGKGNAVREGFDLAKGEILMILDADLTMPPEELPKFWRVVMPGGRVIVFEPAMGLLGKLVYGLLHHEPLALDAKIELFPPPGERAAGHGYYAAQGNAWRIFVKGEEPDLLERWKPLRIRVLCSLSYVLSGGFSRPSLYPPFLLLVVRMMDRVLEISPPIFGTRLLVVLEKAGGQSFRSA